MACRNIRSRRMLMLCAIVLFSLGLLLSQTSLPIDDAFISLRYLHNWLTGMGWVFNPGERVEGYSNFLWIVFLAVPAAAAMQFVPADAMNTVLVPCALVADYVCALGCVILPAMFAFRLGKQLGWWRYGAAVLLAVNPLLVFWAGKGMEVNFYTFLHLLFALLVFQFREDELKHWKSGLIVGLVAAAIALTRPEGMVAPAAVLLALIAADRGRRRSHLAALVLLAAAVAGQIAFRLAYYGLPWPNTYYAKRLPLGLALQGGLNYLRKFAVGMSSSEAWFYPTGWMDHLPVWLVCGIAWVFAVRQWRRLWPIALQMAALVGVAVYVGGDWMPAFRFFLPAVPLGLLLVAAGLKELSAPPAGTASALDTNPQIDWQAVLSAPAANRRLLIAVGLFAVLLSAEAVGLFRMARSHEFDRWRWHPKHYMPAANWLKANAPAGALVALSDIGIISFHNPQLRFLDVLGLTDRHIAAVEGIHYLKTDLDYVLGCQPDYVLVMRFVWPELEKTLPKTQFDRQFLARVEQAKDYEMVQRIKGWREGMNGERYVLFEVYKRSNTTPRAVESMPARSAAPLSWQPSGQAEPTTKKKPVISS
ncbi:MAG: hypothetical protein N3D11_07430 [Candidatus Sumerlaeia bacterium]|nr:hypothetical protein [Candidatus Sumerlaeia bacterium]